MAESYDTLLALPPKQLFSWISEKILVVTPKVIQSDRDFADASETLIHLSSYYTYMVSLLSYAQLMVRETKRSGDKTAYEDMVDRRNIVEHAVKILSQQYAAASRAVTIYMRRLDELKMGA